MRDKYYTATEAAAKLRLEYATFLARVRKGMYEYETWGQSKVFEKAMIDKLAESTASCS